MKEHRLMLQASPCDTNLHPAGPATLAEAKRLGRSICPHFAKCDKGDLANGFQCAIKFGADVARYALKERHSVEREMVDFRDELAGSMSQMARKGIIWSEDRQDFQIISDIEEGIGKIEKFAKMLLEENQPTETVPTESRSFEQLTSQTVNEDGAIDLGKIDAFEGSCGSNGGRGCDVTSGPCSCGAWH